MQGLMAGQCWRAGGLAPRINTSGRPCRCAVVLRACGRVAASSRKPSSGPTEPVVDRRRVDRQSLGMLKGALALTAPLLLDVAASYAGEGEYGILEGRIVSLIHPAVMLSLFGITGYTGYLGWQHKRSRELGDEVRALKRQSPKPKDGDEEHSQADPALENRIKEAEAERKKLMSGGYRDRHWFWGSIILGGGVSTAIFGALNTYLRAGKLFPGPHLFAGAGIVALWATAASLVPAMQKGNEVARALHITLNGLTLALFAWQVPTGFAIVEKVLQQTSFP